MRTTRVWIAVMLLVPLSGSPAAEVASLEPPRHLGPPRSEQAATNRAFTGIPSMAVTPQGRIWATWYAGVTPGEDKNNYVVLSTSGDDGTTWREVLTVDPDGEGPVRAFDPELWVSPDGRLLLFWAQMDRSRRDPELGVWYVETATPDQPQPTWSTPRRIGNGVMMCKPTVLSTGEWALPTSLWREHDKSAQIVVSTDRGRTWSVRGGCNVPADARQFDEHMIVERKDGSLWMLVRTKYGIGESVSTDRGATWPDLRPSAILHTPSRFFVSRLASGSLLLVKHGPLDTRTGRSHLTAFISKDDGATWSGGLLLDERAGVSYPDGQQTPDGTIRIVYDYNRVTDRTILMATFREEDAAAGKDVSGTVRLRQLVGKASGGRKPPQQAAAPVHANADGKPLVKEPAGGLRSGDVAAQPLVAGAKLFSDRRYTAATTPPALAGARLLPIAMDGSKTITCDRGGMVFFLTPVLDRNADSAAQPLLDQGFEKVSLPEVPLFNLGSAANYCTLFQKRCVVGETILIGKWAVPLFFP
jgi:predicted neuraminidase